MVDPQMPDGVQYCVVNVRRRTNRACFANALDPEWVVRRWGLGIRYVDRRYIRGAGDEIRSQIAGQQVPFVVVHHLFDEGLSNALGNFTVYLALDKNRVHDLAGIVEGHHLEDLGFTGFGVDLDDADVCSFRRVCIRIALRNLDAHSTNGWG